MPIRVLDREIVGRIAAGEVVERPTSVAKELIENSIDAGATSITVEIKGGGIELLRVTDNGSGIEPAQLPIAFENHATSKLSTAEQLDDIRTLGFRGEALPSIAAVSRVEMSTRLRGTESGVRLRIEGGVRRPVEEVGCPEGTTVIVRDLFYNVPVRRAFLKKPAYEASVMGDLMTRMILGNPRVSFRYINNGKTVYHSFGDGDLKHAVFAVYGSGTAEQMKPVDGACGSIRIRGMIGVGDCAKQTRAHQAFYVNGRSIRCTLLQEVLEQVCRGRVTIGTHPMCVFFLTMPFDAVDVNVHPNKLEVRFREEETIRLAALQILSVAFGDERMLDPRPEERKETVRQVVLRSGPAQDTPPLKPDTSWKQPSRPDQSPETAAPLPEAQPEKAPVIPGPEPEQKKAEPLQNADRVPGRSLSLKEPVRSLSGTDPFSAKPEAPAKGTREQNAEQVSLFEGAGSRASAEKAPSFRVIGTLFNTYILVELKDRLLMIDQHAAHERLMYERFKARLEASGTVAQQLAVPLSVNVSPREMALILDDLDELMAAGYEVEPFGDNTVLVRTVPFMLGHAEAMPAFMNVIDQLGNIVEMTREARTDEIAMMACKAAVKGGDRLTDSEISSLIETMLRTGVSPTCPHGRPVSRAMTRKEIEKGFRRIQ